ncbi:MAG: hypothetical protein QOH12_662 [Solirubrobacteraceae bacterium]|nr:hypothetical protein [Solirubrobacteraceae bacterium]
MSAGVLAHHGLLVVAVLALGAGAWRVASVLGGRTLERLLVGFTLACAAAVCESLGLGLFGLGGSSAALGVAAVATWAATLVLVERPAVSIGGAIAGWLASAAVRTVGVVGGLGGLGVAWIVWQLRRPLIGGDGLIYHLPIASAWVQNGRPGSIVEILDGLAVANYPVTNEVLVSWGLGLSRSWVVGSIWSVVLLAVLATGAWVALRNLGVLVVERTLAVVAICVLPLVVAQLCGPDTDIAALAWLAVCAALASAARERPGLIGPAVIAGGLCLGTKTTPGILIVGLAVMARRPLAAAFRDDRIRLVVSLVVAIAVGGVWSLRDLIVHGSPFWPLEAAPWGTPVQASLVGLEPSFLSHPRGLIAAHGSDYLQTMAGGLVLLAGGLAVPVLRRSRRALTVAGVAGVALVAWGAAPYTGIDGGDFAAGATRYLLPAIAAATLALALSAGGAGRGLRLGVDAVLVGSIGWSVFRTDKLGHQFVPGPGPLLLGLLCGLAVVALARLAVRATAAGSRSGSGRPAGGSAAGSTPSARRLAGRSAARSVLAAVVAAGACAVGLAVASDGYVARHASTGEIDGPVLKAGLPGLGAGSAGIAAGPATVVMLRGDHLDHPLSLIGSGETCAGLRARLGRETVVLQGEPVTPVFTRLSACLAGVKPEFADPYVDVYR